MDRGTIDQCKEVAIHKLYQVLANFMPPLLPFPTTNLPTPIAASTATALVTKDHCNSTWKPRNKHQHEHEQTLDDEVEHGPLV
jgi:hypothetical protein